MPQFFPAPGRSVFLGMNGAVGWPGRRASAWWLENQSKGWIPFWSTAILRYTASLERWELGPVTDFASEVEGDKLQYLYLLGKILWPFPLFISFTGNEINLLTNECGTFFPSLVIRHVHHFSNLIELLMNLKIDHFYLQHGVVALTFIIELKPQQKSSKQCPVSFIFISYWYCSCWFDLLLFIYRAAHKTHSI